MTTKDLTVYKRPNKRQSQFIGYLIEITLLSIITLIPLFIAEYYTNFLHLLREPREWEGLLLPLMALFGIFTTVTKKYLKLTDK